MTMNRFLMISIAMMLCACSLSAQTDTLHLSAAYTTHIIFSTDLTYADLSNNKIIAARIVEQNKNMLAVKARCPFSDLTSLSALESNGSMHTWIVMYDPSPTELIVDTRISKRIRTESPISREKNMGVSKNGHADAPILSDIINCKQGLFHLGASQYDISVLCENIFAYSDITYVILSLKNTSGVSYDISDATFVVESKKKDKRTVMFEKTLFPRSRYGSLSAGAGEVAKIAYSFDKMTLSKDQILKIYFYESSGQRNLYLTIDTEDINKAARPN